MEHWLEQEIAQWGKCNKVRGQDKFNRNLIDYNKKLHSFKITNLDTVSCKMFLIEPWLGVGVRFHINPSNFHFGILELIQEWKRNYNIGHHNIFFSEDILSVGIGQDTTRWVMPSLDGGCCH